MISKVLAMDLSFTRSGIVLFDVKGKSLTFHRVSTTIGDKSFKNMQAAIASILRDVKKHTEGVQLLVMEEPFPHSHFSSGLYALDSVVYQAHADKEIITYSASLLGHTHGKRKYNKSESVNLALAFIDKFKDEGWSINVKRICHDEAEAFIYGVYALIDKSLLTRQLEKSLSSHKSFKRRICTRDDKAKEDGSTKRTS
jgi:hypothetical protein